MEYQKVIHLKNIKTYHCLMLCTKNGAVKISVNGQHTLIPKGHIVFIEKYVNMQMSLYDDHYPLVVHLDENTVKFIHEFLLSIVDYSQLSPCKGAGYFIRKAPEEDIKLFDKIKEKVDSDFDFIKMKSSINISMLPGVIQLILSFKSEIINSISRQVKPNTRDKIIKIMSEDISKPWKVSMLSELLHVSEISLRKRLESEGVNFMGLLVNLRMMNSLRLLTMTDYSINKIAIKCGYNSTSYFIKIFKGYFGVSPKRITESLR